MVEISTISSPDELNNKLLRSRAERSRSGWASEYIAACIGSSEAALLVLDHYPRTKSAGIHEIFVLEPYRKLGVGTAMLKFAEERARELGCCKIQLEVHPLDASIHKELLLAWYSRHGYEHGEGNRDKLHKVLSDPRL